MKKEASRSQGFDEIVFRNRNKIYGAYNIRKKYNSTTSIAILAASLIFTLLVEGLSSNKSDVKASDPQTGVIVVIADPVTTKYIEPPEQKPLENVTRTINNLKPEVTDDTSAVTPNTLSTDDLLGTVTNGDVNDTTAAIADTPETVIPVEQKPFVRVEEMPEYPGGLGALMKFIGENLNYPSKAQELNIQGKVLLQFVVSPDGSITDINVLKGVDPLLDAEAIRVVKTLPRFRPGKQGGVPVPVYFSLPVSFRIAN